MIFYPSLDVYCPLVFSHPLVFFPSMNFCHSLKSCCPWVFFPLLDVYCPWVFAHPLVFCCQWLFAHNFVDCCTWASFCQIGCCSPSLSFCRCSARQLVLAAMSFCPPLDICSPWVFAHHLMFAVHEFLICGPLCTRRQCTFQVYINYSDTIRLGQYCFVWST